MRRRRQCVPPYTVPVDTVKNTIDTPPHPIPFTRNRVPRFRSVYYTPEKLKKKNKNNISRAGGVSALDADDEDVGRREDRCVRNESHRINNYLNYYYYYIVVVILFRDECCKYYIVDEGRKNFTVNRFLFNGIIA